MELSALKTEASAFFGQLQDKITKKVESYEPTARFLSDKWDRDGGGGGDTRVLEGGDIFEKAGVNTSLVFGELDPKFADSLPGDGLSFWASGISLIFHPRNPHIPTVHANFRMIQRGSAAWFGGGADLTPYYPVHGDCVHFHRTLKNACDKHDPAYYSEFKSWCDRYFFLPHRNEARGIGGIFFDRLTESDEHSKEARFAFVQDAGEAFLDAYFPIVDRRVNDASGERERAFQLLRRGRYVEFNLLWDRGTQFGLKTKGRTESILVSMPPKVAWEYDFTPEPGSPEAAIYDYLSPRDWASL